MEAISMEDIKEKLKNLREYLPNQEESIYNFCSYLTGYLNPKLVPEGFNMAIELAFYDLGTGINGLTGKSVRNSLSRRPLAVYALIRRNIPEILDVVCPEDFANEVKEIIKEIQRRCKE